MIVRDEEEHLAQCLESARSACDEIIVVDTGSVDGTREIALSFGARVFDQPWTGDFSRARNESLRHAQHRWILQLDADESLEREDLDALKRLGQRQPDRVYQLYILNSLPSGGVSSFYSPRLFPNGQHIEYQGSVHNQLVYSLPDETTPIRLHHIGYALEPERMKRKFDRSAPLLREQIEDRPDDPYPAYYLASFCFNQERYDEAILEARRSLERGRVSHRDVLLELATWDLLGLALEKIGQLDDAIGCYEEALKRDPTFVDAHFDLAHLEERRGNPDRAIGHYLEYFAHRDAWQFSARASRIILRSVESPAIVWNNLAACYRRVGKSEEARHAFERSVSIDGRLPIVRKNFACLLASLGELAHAETHFREARLGAVSEPETGNQHAVILAQLGRREEAAEILRELTDRFPDHAGVRRNLELITGY